MSWQRSPTLHHALPSSRCVAPRSASSSKTDRRRVTTPTRNRAVWRSTTSRSPSTTSRTRRSCRRGDPSAMTKRSSWSGTGSRRKARRAAYTSSFDESTASGFPTKGSSSCLAGKHRQTAASERSCETRDPPQKRVLRASACAHVSVIIRLL